MACTIPCLQWRFIRKSGVSIGLLSGLLAMAAPGWSYDLIDNAITHARHGERLMETGQSVEAIEEFRSALLLNPYTSLSASIYNNMGLAYRNLRNFPYAIASFQRACRIQPVFALYFRNLVETYAAAGVLPQAEMSMTTIVGHNPDNAEAWFLLGLMNQASGYPEKSRQCFERFLELQPESELARAAQGYLRALSPPGDTHSP